MINKYYYREYIIKNAIQHHLICFQCSMEFVGEREKYRITHSYGDKESRKQYSIDFCKRCWHNMAGTLLDLEE
jgi:hypothetical protein